MTTTFDDARPDGWPADAAGIAPDDVPAPLSRPIALRVAVAAPIVGFLFDRTVLTSSVGLGAALFVASLGWAGAAVHLSIRRPTTMIVPSLITVLAAWLAIRSSPWLIATTMLTCLMLIVLGPSVRSWADLTVGGRFDWLHRVRSGVGSLGTFVPLAAWVTARLRTSAANRFSPRHHVSLTSVLWVGSVALVMIMLLASGDAVFASMFTAPGDGSLLAHPILMVLGAMMATWAVLASATAQSGGTLSTVHRTATAEATMLLGTITAVLAMFAFSQLLTLSYGRDYVVERTGLTFAEYARRGFFQLLAVVVIVLIALLAARMMTAADFRPPPRRIVVLSAATTVLTLGLVAVSLRRMFLYEAEFGLTMMRLHVIGFALWMALVLVAVAATTAGFGRRWLGPVVVLSAVLGVLALNAINPERIVVERNLARADDGHDVDLSYLARLSHDGQIALLEGVDEANEAMLRSLMCGYRSISDAPTDVWSNNQSRRRHAQLIEDLCV